MEYLCIVIKKKKIMKYKAIYFREDSEKILGTFSERDNAVDALINAGEHNYCLDNREERIAALQLRDFYMCGCGPNYMKIEEVE